MPLIPNFVERLALLRANLGPGPTLDLFGAIGFRVVRASTRAGVFDQLAAGAMTASALADGLGLDPRATRSLLTLLETLGYVKRRDEEYSLTRMSRKWLLSESEVPFGDFLRWWDEAVFPFWDEHLDEALRDGEPPIDLYEWLDLGPDRWLVAQEGFEAAARLVAPAVVRSLVLPSGRGTLADLGGGHGLFAIEMCRQNPGWEAVVVDSSGALGAAQRNIEEARLEDRVKTRVGEALEGDFGSGYGAVLMFNLIHGFGAGENRHILGHVRRAMIPGGVVAILDQFGTGPPGAVTTFGAQMLDLAYLAAFGGQTYTADTVLGWLEAEGFHDRHVKRLRGAPGNSLVIGSARLDERAPM